jgi:hypothetical protein
MNYTTFKDARHCTSMTVVYLPENACKLVYLPSSASHSPKLHIFPKSNLYKYSAQKMNQKIVSGAASQYRVLPSVK